LNSSDPFRSIGLAVKQAPAGVLIGAGTVLTVANVDQLHDVGGKLNGLAECRHRGAGARASARHGGDARRVSHRPRRCLRRVSGASSLKFFPASVLGASGIAAIRAVLPAGVMIAAVGGVSDQNFAEYIKGGVTAFGLGSSLYKPGMTAAEVAVRAKATIAAYDRANL